MATACVGMCTHALRDARTQHSARRCMHSTTLVSLLCPPLPSPLPSSALLSAHPTCPLFCPPLLVQGDKTSIWVRNVQLCLFSIPLQLLAVYQRDWDKVQANGWMHGFCPSTWAVVCMFAFGGLLVAVVIRFADNNLKNLAMALAILLSCLASVRGGDGGRLQAVPFALSINCSQSAATARSCYIATALRIPAPSAYLRPPCPPPQVPLFGFAPNGAFGLGAALVVASIFLYAWTPKPAAGVSNYVPVASGEPRQGSPSKV